VYNIFISNEVISPAKLADVAAQRGPSYLYNGKNGHLR
jgi:hypothetical protein